MFSGIIKKTGIINKLYINNNNCVLEIKTSLAINKNEVGSSISCSGTCLTLESYKNKISKFFISNETLNKTNFKYLKKGDKVNLEKSLKYGERISGHFVQGHIDTTCIVKKINYVGKSWIINFKLSKKFKKYLINKGSIAINGVSLTISKILTEGFETVVIPHTIKLTNLYNLKKNDFLNVEFDILSKYIKNFIK